MNLDWLSAYLIYALFTVAGTIGLGQLLHLQMGLAGIGNFGIVGFFGLGMYTYGVFLVRIPWPESWGVVGPFLHLPRGCRRDELPGRAADRVDDRQPGR